MPSPRTWMDASPTHLRGDWLAMCSLAEREDFFRDMPGTRHRVQVQLTEDGESGPVHVLRQGGRDCDYWIPGDPNPPAAEMARAA